MTRCVFTVVTGGYETLNEQPAAHDSSLPFICFTDTPDVTSETWEIRRLVPIFGQDDIRDHRRYKLLAHKFLPEFETSLYIDNAVLLEAPPERLFDTADLSSGMSLPAHSFRASLLDEFLEVAKGGLDDPARIAEQLAHYRLDFPEILHEKPFWGGILLRDHTNMAVVAAMDIWLAHLCRYSRRDQLSAQVAFAQAGLRPDVLRIDNYKSPFHSWPHIASRKAERRLWRSENGDEGPAAQVLAAEDRAAALNARTIELTHQLAELHRAHGVLLASTSWRMMAPLRALVKLGRQLRSRGLSRVGRGQWICRRRR